VGQEEDSLLIVTWDEDEGRSSNHIATIFFGAHVKSGKVFAEDQYFNVLRAIEEASSVALVGKSAVVGQIKDVWGVRASRRATKFCPRRAPRTPRIQEGQANFKPGGMKMQTGPSP